ncbi:alpha/beta fold hydrolase [Streptomyces sp. ODS28]|uniref:alpha/beta fold hydrolase n=1 Tax=Streptomyces sp. ODS28 TaxID=3136688 RepID=UPI0031EA7425
MTRWTTRTPGLATRDHVVRVPLDHAAPGRDAPHIEVYARELVSPSALHPSGSAPESLPALLFLQGGPGGRSPRPLGADTWLARALQEYRVVLLDQRGTGRSTPATRQTLPLRGNPVEQADYLAHFRADSIVRDAEILRAQILGPETPWTILGQSFGGFCAFTYLSLAPEGVREALVTGGTPSLHATADEVYRAAYPRVARKNHAHYARHPQDATTVRRIAEHLGEHDVRLPDRSPLTVERFQSLGLMLGEGHGSDRLHYLLEDAWVPGPGGPVLSDAFLSAAHQQLSFAGNPLFALLHEPIYAQRSVSPEGTRWAAQRVRAEYPEFDAQRALQGDQPVLFTGEMIYPWTVEADPALQPLAETAGLLAERTDWPDLYSPARLAANEVPVHAAVYHDDMYVDRDHSLTTAGQVPCVRTWITNEWEHDALRVSGGRVLDRLLGMSRGER